MSTFQRCLAVVVILYVLYSFSFLFSLNKADFFTNGIFSSRDNYSAENNSKVVIGAVFCRKGNIKGNRYYSETIVMIKSVLISAKLFNISTVEIHLFLEYSEDEKNFREDIQKMGDSDNFQSVKFILQAHSAVDVVPEKYRKHMIYHSRFRCGYVRFFYPTALPNVDSIMHLDSDIIVTGNIMRHWDLLGQMNEKQLISVGYNRQPGNNKYLHMDKAVFKDAPFVPPKGVNSGVLVMNLTRMRSQDVVNKLVEVYENYFNKTELHDQKVLNILLYYEPDLLQIMPCQLHFIGSDCEKGFYCESAFDDIDGIHLIHGNAYRFTKGKLFYPVFKFYSEFNVSSSNGSLVNDLMIPIQQAYSKKLNNKNKCYGNVDRAIFKRFLN